MEFKTGLHRSTYYIGTVETREGALSDIDYIPNPRNMRSTGLRQI